jgi:hypothetical protein
MLLEHKEKGREAISQLVRHLSQTPEREVEGKPETVQRSGPEMDSRKGQALAGLDSLIEDLCAHTAGVVRDLSVEEHRFSKASNTSAALPRQAAVDKQEHEKVRRFAGMRWRIFFAAAVFVVRHSFSLSSLSRNFWWQK